MTEIAPTQGPQHEQGPQHGMGIGPVPQQLALRAAPLPRKRRKSKKSRSPDNAGQPAPAQSGRDYQKIGPEQPTPTLAQQARRPSSGGTWQNGNNFHLVVATEPAGRQRLLLAGWLYLGYRGRVVAEGVVLGPALEEAYGQEAAVGAGDRVRAWASQQRSRVKRPASPDQAHPSVLDMDDFVEGPLYRWGIRGRPYQDKSGKQQLARGANLVCFDAAPSLSRFAKHAGPALSGAYRGGLSMALSGEPAPPGIGRPWVDDPGFPRFLAHQLNPDVTLVGWANDRLMAADGVLPGRVIDPRHLGQALSGQSCPSFDGLCRLFGVEGPGPQPGLPCGPCATDDRSAAPTDDQRQLTIDDASAAVPAAVAPADALVSLLAWLDARLQAQVELYEALMAEADLWRDSGATKLRPPFLFSAGSFSDQVLSSAGYTPPERKATLPLEARGAFAGAFFGGRTEATLLRWPFPGVVEDFSSNYVTCANLLGVSELFAVEEIGCEDVTSELQQWLDELADRFADGADADNLDNKLNKLDNNSGKDGADDIAGLAGLFDPATWRHWGCTVAMVDPVAGEWLPNRVVTDEANVAVGLSPLYSPGQPLPFMWPDLVAAMLKGGKGTFAPRVQKAWRLTTIGSLPAPAPVKIPGTGVDLGEGDFFAGLLAARQQLRQRAEKAASEGERRVWRRREAAVKRLGNSAAFGNLARFDRAPAAVTATPATGDDVEVLSPWGATFEARLAWSEDDARWTFPPAAAAVTAAARLVVALAEYLLTDMGGTVAAIHTDSLMVPASPEGGLWPCPGGPLTCPDGDGPGGEAAIKLLSWAEIDRALAPFDALRPDGLRAWKVEHGTRDDPSRLLQVELFGSNRYVVFDPVSGEIVHATETSLGGVLLDPSTGPERLPDERLPDGRRRWVDEGLPALLGDEPLPEWASRPAVSVWRATNMRQLKWLRHCLPDAQPFTSFLLAHPGRTFGSHRLGSRTGGTAPLDEFDELAERERRATPIAPFDPDPLRWAGLPWRQRDGTLVWPQFEHVLGAEGIRAFHFRDRYASVADHVARWRAGHDVGSLPRYEAQGRLASTAQGLFYRVSVEALPSIVLVGKEGDKLLESACKVVIDPAERLTWFSGRGDLIGGVPADLVRALAGHFREDLARALPDRTARAFAAGRGLSSRNAAAVLRALDRIVTDKLLAAKVPVDILRDQARPARYEMARRVVEVGTAGACELPECEELAKPGGRFCCERHRKIMAERCRRASKRALVEPVRIVARHVPTAPDIPDTAAKAARAAIAKANRAAADNRAAATADNRAAAAADKGGLS